jgi:DNA-binding GntR family transcriptional regulator
MSELRESEGSAGEQRAEDAEQQFHDALLRAHHTHGFVGEMESAAAQFCRELRRQGHPPERMLRDAKRVIEQAIDGDDVPVAERAVLSCIQHYYRVD